MHFKALGLIVISISVFFAVPVSGQSIIVPVMVSLTQDTLVENQLVTSLNGFLNKKDGPNKDNRYVLQEDLPETSVLLDELKNIEQSSKYNDKEFYKCHLTNFVKLDANNYLVQ